MNNTTAAHPLPDGHEDPASPYYIPAELRAAYASDEGTPTSDGFIKSTATAIATYERDLANWEIERQRAAAQGREAEDKFLQDFRTFDGRPAVRALRLNGVVLADAEPTAAHFQLARHRYRLDAAQVVAQQQAQLAAAEADAVIRRTCQLCAAVGPPGSSPVLPLGTGAMTHQLRYVPPHLVGRLACVSCAVCVEVVAMLSAPTPAGATRGEVIARLLADSPDGHHAATTIGPTTGPARSADASQAGRGRHGRQGHRRR